jgi:5-methylcytosine-specific restriction endonuclease McrA
MHAAGPALLRRSVLVLNQSYEPVQVCSVRRAIVLVYRGRAEVIETHDSCVRTVTRKFPVPSVVRLVLYVRVSPKSFALSKRNVMKRDGYQCQYCGTKQGPMTVDHVIPRTLGGRDSWENLVCACVRCNNLKGDRLPDKAGVQLLRKPRRPSNALFITHFVGVPDSRWRPYLFLDA